MGMSLTAKNSTYYVLQFDITEQQLGVALASCVSGPFDEIGMRYVLVCASGCTPQNTTYYDILQFDITVSKLGFAPSSCFNMPSNEIETRSFQHALVDAINGCRMGLCLTELDIRHASMTSQNNSSGLHRRPA